MWVRMQVIFRRQCVRDWKKARRLAHRLLKSAFPYVLSLCVSWNVFVLILFNQISHWPHGKVPVGLDSQLVFSCRAQIAVAVICPLKSMHFCVKKKERVWISLLGCSHSQLDPCSTLIVFILRASVLLCNTICNMAAWEISISKVLPFHRVN